MMKLSHISRLHYSQLSKFKEFIIFSVSTMIAEEIETRYGLALFEPRSFFGDFYADCTSHGLTLSQWSDRVKAVAGVFGPPEKVATDRSYANDRAPDLFAEFSVDWDKFPDTFEVAKLVMIINPFHAIDPKMNDAIVPFTRLHKNVRLVVRNMDPVGCKLDPRVVPVERVAPELHPECKDVLKELEDVGAEVSP